MATTDSSEGGFRRLRDDETLKAYAAANLWEDRRDRGLSWRTDVFVFIEEVYKPWLGHGLLQSDLKVLDPKLYGQLQKRLSALPASEKESVLARLKLPKERSDDALRVLIEDPVERAIVAGIRRFHRERTARQRARK